MNCLYCGEKLGLFSKGRQFCNGKHQELFRQRESEDAFRRLMDPFGTGESPAAKAKTETQSPAPEPPPTRVRVATNTESFALAVTREVVEAPPSSQVPPKEPDRGAAAVSSNSSPDRPPLAGFIAYKELTALQRLPVFTRRPEWENLSGLGPRTLDPRFIDRMLTRRAADERGAAVAFIPTLCIPAIPGCEPERHAGRIFVELPDRKVPGALPTEPRKLDFPVCTEPSTALETPPFAPYAEESEARVLEASPTACDVQPILMCRRALESKPAVARYSESVQAYLPQVAGPQVQAAASPAPRTLGASIARGMPALPNFGFLALPAARAVRAVPASATAPNADLPDRKLSSTAAPIGSRNLAFHARKSPAAALNTLAFAPYSNASEPTRHCVFGATHQARPIAMSRRALECKPLVARYPDTVQTSSTSLAGQLFQTTSRATPAQTFGVAIGRTGRALPNSGFQALPLEHKAPVWVASASLQCAQLPDQTALSTARPIEARNFHFQPSKLPSAALEPLAFLPDATEMEPKAYGLSRVSHDVRSIALSRREVERDPVAAQYPAVPPASLPRIANRLPQAARSFKAPRVAAAIDRIGLSLPHAAFEALPFDYKRPDLPARVGAQFPIYAPSTKEPVRPLALSRRESQPQLVATRFPQIVFQPSSPEHVAGPQPRAVRFSKAPRALAAAIGRLLPALPNAAFQALPIAQKADVWTGAATAPHAQLPHRKFSCTALPIERRRFVSRAWKSPSAALQTPVFAPHRWKSQARLHAASGAVYDLQPATPSRRRAQSQLLVAQYPEIRQTSLPARAVAAPETAGYSAAPRALGAEIGRIRPELANSTFRAFPVLPKTTVVSPQAAPQCAALPDRKLLLAGLGIEPSQCAPHAWTSPSASFRTAVFAPYPKKLQAKRVCVAADAEYDARPIAMSRRAAEHQASIAKYPEMIQASSEAVAVQQPRAARHSTATRALPASIGQLRTVRPNAAFQALPAGYTAPVGPSAAATPQWHSSMAGATIRNRQRQLQFADVASIWSHPSGLLEMKISTHQPEVVPLDADYTLACPARPGKPFRFHRFVAWSQSPSEVEPLQQASFSSLQTSVNAVPDNASLAANLAGLAGWIRARELPDPSEPVFEPPRPVTIPVEHLPAAPVTLAPAAQQEWSAGGVGVMEEEPLPAEADSPSADELARVLAQLGARTGTNSTLKWTPLKVPWIPM